MSQYEVNRHEIDGEKVYRLHDRSQNCRVDIAASFGMNVIRYRWQGRDLIVPPPSFEALKATPYRYGIPILSPPGVTGNGSFMHRGVRYELPITHGKNNVHGEIGRLPWTVRQFGTHAAAGAFLQAEYKSRNEQVRWRLTYLLKDGSLSLEGEASNEGDGYAPFALGFHPYFPFAGARQAVSIRIPAGADWPRNDAGSVSGLPRQSPIADRLRSGIALDQLTDSLYYLECSDDRRQSAAYTCFVTDQETGLSIAYQVDCLFSKMMLFIPTWADAISLEPHTCVPDAFNLALDGKRTGVLELAPGETKRFGWMIHARIEERES